MRARSGSDAAIAALATRQGGRVSRRQLLGLGLSAAAISRRMAAGRLIAEWPGVYLVGHGAPVRDGRWWGALLLAGDGALLSHRSAAEAHGLLPPRGALIHVTAPRQVADRGHVRFHRVAGLVACRVDGLPVTTVGRTLVDLGRAGPGRALERALEEAAARGVLDVGELPERLPPALGRALADHHAGSTVTASELEERFLALVRRAGIRAPECNVRLALPHGDELTVDALWRPERVAVELQSWRHHRTRFEADHRKRALLELSGHRLLAFTWRMVVDDEALVVRRLRHALTAP